MAATLHLRLQPPPTHRRRIPRPRRLPVQCAEARQVMFSRIAPVYDNLNDVLSLGQHRIWKRMSVSWSGNPAKISHIRRRRCEMVTRHIPLQKRIEPFALEMNIDISSSNIAAYNLSMLSIYARKQFLQKTSMHYTSSRNR